MGVILSPKHGVNATIPICYVCQEPKNEIVLLGKLKGDAEAPRNAVFNHEPCDKCKEFMGKGIICISIRDNEHQSNNPYRTGGWCVVKAEAFANIFQGDAGEDAKKRRIAFIEDQVWDMVGLPRHDVAEREVTGGKD